MKFKKLDKELEFINSADVKTLQNYVVKYPFSAKAEREFFKKAPVSLGAFYLKKYKVKNTALSYIFSANNPTLVSIVLESANENPSVIPAMLTFGEYNVVKKYLKRHHVPEYHEQKLINELPENELRDYIMEHRLSQFAKYDLIMRGNPKIVPLVIAKGGLSAREKFAVVRYGRKEEVEFLARCERNFKFKEAIRQMAMIRFSSRHECERFIAQRRFVKDAENYFLHNAQFTLVVKYVKHYNIENGQEVLIRRNDRTEILNFLSKNWLCPSGERLLLERGIHPEIKAYIKRHNFNDEREIRFIKRGNHREIMLYLSVHSLSDLAQVELMYRRNHEEIMLFITHYPLADIAIEAFMKCANDQAVDYWMKNPIEEKEAV